MAGHTPGPWVVMPDADGDLGGRVGTADRNTPVADVWDVAGPDARLIAAAPDLLAIAKEIDLLSVDMEHSDDCSFALDNIVVAHNEGRSVNGCDCWLSRLRDVIAKAEGR